MHRKYITDRLMTFAPIAFDRMGKNINSCSCRNLGWHCISKFRINDSSKCCFTSCSCSRRNCDQWKMFLRHCYSGSMILTDGIRSQSYTGSCFGTIHGTASTQCYHKSDIFLPDHFRTGIYLYNVRVWRNISKRSNDHSF